MLQDEARRASMRRRGRFQVAAAALLLLVLGGWHSLHLLSGDNASGGVNTAFVIEPEMQAVLHRLADEGRIRKEDPKYVEECRRALDAIDLDALRATSHVDRNVISYVVQLIGRSGDVDRAWFVDWVVTQSSDDPAIQRLGSYWAGRLDKIAAQGAGGGGGRRPGTAKN